MGVLYTTISVRAMVPGVTVLRDASARWIRDLTGLDFDFNCYKYQIERKFNYDAGRRA